MADIFREIDEDVRRERYLRLWRKYGIYVIAAALVIVLGVAGTAVWRQYTQQQALAYSNDFSGALALARDGRHAEAAEAFGRLAADAGGGYGVLARLQEAAAQVAAGDRAAAVATYDGLAADSGAPARLRDLAALLAALHLMDTAEPAELDRRLQPLAEPGNTWQYTARELLALVRLKAGDVVAARQAFAALADDANAPSGVRGRAAELLAALPEAK